MDATTKKRTKRDWPTVFEEFYRSGMSIKEFCHIKGMAQSLFYRHRKNYSASDTGKGSSLGLSEFVELKSASSSRRSASILFPGQIELSISNDCDKELLGQIISQLKGSQC